MTIVPYLSPGKEFETKKEFKNISSFLDSAEKNFGPSGKVCAEFSKPHSTCQKDRLEESFLVSGIVRCLSFSDMEQKNRTSGFFRHDSQNSILRVQKCNLGIFCFFSGKLRCLPLLDFEQRLFRNWGTILDRFKKTQSLSPKKIEVKAFV